MEKGGKIWYYIYDTYGNLLQKEGSTENEFLYTGEQYNANPGLYYLRARYMDPSTGTFINMDSYQGSIYDPVTLHKYRYANANPMMYTDPSGYSALGLAVRIDAESTLRISQIMYDSTIFKIGMKVLSALRTVKLFNIIRNLVITSAVVVIFVSSGLNGTSRWAICFNRYAENDVLSEIPEDVEEESLSDEEETSEDSDALDEKEEGRRALDQLGKELEDEYRHNGSRITEDEARIIDELCKEYGRSQKHDTDYYFEHPHIGGRHIPFQ